MQQQEGEADWGEGQRTWGGKGEVGGLISVVPKRAKKQQSSSLLVPQG